MALMLASIVLLLFCSACSSQLRGVGIDTANPEQEWNRLAALTEPTEERTVETKLLKSSSGTALVPREVPASVFVSLTDDPKALLKPDRNARPLPPQVITILQKTPSVTVGPVIPKLVELLCHFDRIYVRVLRSYFFTTDAYKYLKLGGCPVNAATKKHYYLLYPLTRDCRFNIQSFIDYRSIKNELCYKPTGPVLREVPFSVPLQCKYYRYVHSYSAGFYPKLQGGTIFRALSSGFSLTSIDASGNEIPGIKTFTLGQPMYFEASQKSSGGTSTANKRVYVNKCVVTTSQDPNSTPSYTVIDGQGCMLDSKLSTQSKFIAGTSKMSPRISVGALVFNNRGVPDSSTSQQLYMHCDISVGSVTPSPSSKACTYDQSTKRWKELYGDNSVCSCCPNCPLPRTPRTMISSHSWLVSDVDELPSDSLGPSHKDLKILED